MSAPLLGRTAAGLALVAFLLGAVAGCDRAVRRRTSVVLVVIDTLRQDRVGIYSPSPSLTPTLDQLAAEGVVLDGLAPSSWTKPSTASVLTGLHPLRHQAYRRDDALPEEAATLAEVFRQEGYRTVGVSANGWVSEGYGFAQGFDLFSSMLEVTGNAAASAEQVNAEVRRQVEELQPPFFLYIHYVDPHTPYAPTEGPFDEPLPPDLVRLVPLDDDDLDPHRLGARSPELVRQATSLYDAEVYSVDRELGRLLMDLERRELLETALIVITSDHGEELEDHGRMGHGHSVYEELVRVPLIFAGAGLEPRHEGEGRRPTMTSMDIVPSILHQIGLGAALTKMPYRLDGSPRLGSGSSATTEGVLLHLDDVTGHGLAWIRDGRKLVLGKYPYVKSIFDVDEDPAESMDLLRSDAGNASLVGQELRRMAGELAATYNGLRREGLPRRRVVGEEATVAALSALGYVGSTSERDATVLPRRILPADPRPGGSLGWRSGRLDACVRPGERESEEQLVAGWHWDGATSGRYSRPEATLELAVPGIAGDLLLAVAGVNYRQAAFRLAVLWNGTSVAEREIGGGRFAISATIPDAIRGRDQALVRLVSSPPFPLSRLGLEDRRTVGAFFSEICVISRANAS